MKLTIDPGISGTGWALWDDKWKLKAHGVINAPSKFPWEDKCRCVMKQLRSIGWKIEGRTEAWVELPKQMGGARGAATAAGGSLRKLTVLVGMIMNEFDARTIEVNDWKGQLPKEVVAKRVMAILPNCTAKSHAMDAVGIGLYVAGRF